MRLVTRLATHIEHGLAAERPESRIPIPGVTFALISTLYLVTRLFPQVTTSLAIPLLGFLVAAFWWGNLFSALLGAFVLSAYALIETDLDPWRSGQLIVASVAGAFLVIAVREALIRQIKEAERARRAENLVNAADKTLADLKGEYKRISDLVQGWAVLAPKAQFELIVEHRGKLANILQSGMGFHELYLQQQEVKKGDAPDG